MPRLLIFLGFCLAIGLTFNLVSYQKIPLTNNYFSMQKAQEDFDGRKKLLEELASRHSTIEIQDEGQEEDSPKLSIDLSDPLVKKGLEVYTKLGKCQTCHGKFGEGKKSQQSPKLAGQFDWYLEEQLNLMKNNIRENPKMSMYLKRLGPEDFKAVAAFLSQLPPR